MIMVTGASGGLGQLIVKGLAGRDDVVISSRNPAHGRRRIDFDDPATLAEGFRGIDTLLLISAGYGEDDVVIARHEAAISAAEKAGVGHIVYTSLTGDGDHLTYALAHRWTEHRLRRGTTAWTILRNGLYAEFFAGLMIPDANGRITAPLGDGRLSAVAREDLAEVAVKVTLEAAAHAGRTYELVGEEAIGGGDVAAALGASYEPATLAEARSAVASFRLEPFQVPMIMSTFSSTAGGFMSGTASDLRALLGGEPRRALDIIAPGQAAR
ncbi:NAD(P)H-binding protein [Nonomuraea sp. NPDC059194]|uniref:NAD(P)H-binding protein n=1 Tax=Nonomuraea sp. NPDC059194 TaxID=3346764 RepID=UPI0036A6CFC9